MKSRAPGGGRFFPLMRRSGELTESSAVRGRRRRDRAPPTKNHPQVVFCRARRPDGKLIVPGVRGEQISFIAHRLDAIRLGRAVEQFFPQARNRHIHTAIHTIVTDAAQIF